MHGALASGLVDVTLGGPNGGCTALDAAMKGLASNYKLVHKHPRLGLECIQDKEIVIGLLLNHPSARSLTFMTKALDEFCYKLRRQENQACLTQEAHRAATIGLNVIESFLKRGATVSLIESETLADRTTVLCQPINLLDSGAS